MGTRVPVEPIRLHCPTCRAEPGEKCIAVVKDERTQTLSARWPPVEIVGFHSTRKLAARQGWV